jgi:hypothetical protein
MHMRILLLKNGHSEKEGFVWTAFLFPDAASLNGAAPGCRQ